jgi:protein O-GlcNAc transferase
VNRKHRRAAAKLAPGAAAMAPAGAANLLGVGLQHHQAGRLAEAEHWYRRVLMAQPTNADALHLLGVVAHQVGRHDAAVDLIGQAIRRNAQNPVYFSNLGIALYVQGKCDEAVAAYRKAIGIKPDYADACYNLGNVLYGQGKRDEAVAAYRQAISIKHDYVEAHNNLGSVLQVQGKLADAVASFRQALALRPDYAEAHNNLGNVLRVQGKVAAAVASFQQALVLKPDYAEAHNNLGNAFHAQGKLADALASFERTLALKPDFVEAHYNMGNVFQLQEKLADAVECYERALALKPDHAEAHCNLGSALKEQVKLEEAVAAYRRAIGINPDYAEAFSNMLFCLNYDDKSTADELCAAHREWDERYGRPAARPMGYANARELGRRLRIGYVSGDFCRHSVAYFLEPLLRNHDHEAVEVFCYAEVGQQDAMTQRLRGFADHWLATVGMTDEALAQRITEDGIDILIDLAGHTGKNRLRVFARKPAPIQVTWLGYPNTTGLTSIDYRLVDAITDPEGVCDAFASETLIRLDGGFLCYDPVADVPAPSPPPSLTSGVVTFGSFNNPAKVSAATFDVWAALLVRQPRARLLLKGLPFADAGTRASFLTRLGERGLAAERVELVARLPGMADHLALYNRVDIALDPFPYNGTTTTCEAMWMGVPVVVRKGDRHAGRVGVSLLSQIGLTDLIANSAEEYVEIALRLANDPARLSELRHLLRPRMAASSLGDGRAFARKMEAALRDMWQRWCSPTNPINQDASSHRIG